MTAEWQSISILGKADAEDAGNNNNKAPDKYWVTLDRSGWIGGEPGNNAGKILSATSGSWKHETSTQTGEGVVCRAGGKVVIMFLGLNPDTVKVGGKGRGHAEGTGREIEWTVQSL